MFLLQLVLHAVVFPLLASAICLWVLLTALRNSDQRFSLAAAVSLGVGYLTGHLGAVGAPPFPPVDTTQWLFFVVVLSVPVAILHRKAGRWRMALAAGLIAALLATALRPMLSHYWDAGEALLWGMLLFAAISGLWLSLDFLADGAAASLIPFSLAWVTLAAAVVLALSASSLLAQLGISAAVCMALIASYSMVSRLPTAGAIPIAIVVLAGLLLNGYYYAELTGWNATFLAIALPAAWLSRIPPIRHWSERRRLLFSLLAVMLITTPALVGAGLSFQADPGYDYEYSGSPGLPFPSQADSIASRPPDELESRRRFYSVQSKPAFRESMYERQATLRAQGCVCPPCVSGPPCNWRVACWGKGEAAMPACACSPISHGLSFRVHSVTLDRQGSFIEPYFTHRLPFDVESRLPSTTCFLSRMA